MLKSKRKPKQKLIAETKTSKIRRLVAPLESTQTGRYQLRIVDLGTAGDDGNPVL